MSFFSDRATLSRLGAVRRPRSGRASVRGACFVTTASSSGHFSEKIPPIYASRSSPVLDLGSLPASRVWGRPRPGRASSSVTWDHVRPGVPAGFTPFSKKRSARAQAAVPRSLPLELSSSMTWGHSQRVQIAHRRRPQLSVHLNPLGVPSALVWPSSVPHGSGVERVRV